MMHNLFLTLEPFRHLNELVFVIGRLVSIFRKVNMKPFGCLRIVIIGCSEKFNRSRIVDEKMKFGNVKVTSNPKNFKYIFITVEIVKCVVESDKGFRGVDRVLRQIEEI